jgi:hypothetical protein
LSIQPDYSFLKLKTGITNATQLKERIFDHCNKIDMVAMSKDVEPFLFKISDTIKIIHFPALLEQHKID